MFNQPDVHLYENLLYKGKLLDRMFFACQFHKDGFNANSYVAYKVIWSGPAAARIIESTTWITFE